MTDTEEENTVRYDLHDGEPGWHLMRYALETRDRPPEELADEPASVSLVYMIVKHDGPLVGARMVDAGFNLQILYDAIPKLEKRGLVRRTSHPQVRTNGKLLWIPEVHQDPLESVNRGVA